MAAALQMETVDKMRQLYAQGICQAEIAKMLGTAKSTVSHYLGYVGRRQSKVTPEMVEDMKTYRELGLSNSQIAIEMGLSTLTVSRHIGPQKTGAKAEYGSIKNHVTGESFAPHKESYEAKKKENSAVSLEKVDVATMANPPEGLRILTTELVIKGNGRKYYINGSQITIVDDDPETIPCEKEPGMFVKISELDGMISELECLKVLLKNFNAICGI